MGIISFILSSFYLVLLNHFFRGAKKLGIDAKNQKQARLDNNLPGISIVVPLRNEEETAAATLAALAGQDYSGNWEVICVDDRSTDNTLRIIQTYVEQNPRFRMVSINPEAPKIISPKKRALQKGFEIASFEILMTTDADCMPPTNWVSSMAQPFQSGAEIVQGPKKIIGDKSVVARYQEMEVFGWVSIEAATFALGKPMLASAPSLAYRKKLFEDAGGFSGMEDLVSGDDDMLVHRMSTLCDGRVAYNLSPSAAVMTPPVYSWGALLKQRARWASNGSKYENKLYVATLSMVFLFYLWLIISPVLWLIKKCHWFWPLSSLVVKILADFVFLRKVNQSLKIQKMSLDFVWSEILHIPVVIIAVISGHLGWYKWKG